MSPEWVSAIADVVVAVAAAVAAWYVRSGLMTWQQEMKGRTEYETARRVLRASYRVRDDFASVRSNFTLSFGVPANETLEQRAMRVGKEFQEKIETLRGSLQELWAESTEGEVLWGLKIKSSVGELDKCATRLLLAIAAHLKEIRSPGEKEPHEQVFANPDQLSEDISKELRNIEEKIRPFLGPAR